MDFLLVLLAAPGCTVLVPSERHAQLLVQTVSETANPTGNLFHDLATAVLMREHGVLENATADTDFGLGEAHGIPATRRRSARR